jgi:hypothetical protein
LLGAGDDVGVGDDVGAGEVGVGVEVGGEVGEVDGEDEVGVGALTVTDTAVEFAAAPVLSVT